MYPKFMGRHLTKDGKTQLHAGRRFTRDSSLSFFISQLEAFDPTFHKPLVEVSWGRDIDLRPGITLSHEATSFMRNQFAGNGTLQNTVGNMPWVSAESTAIPGVQINGQKVTLPLRLLAREISYTSPELERSQLLGASIDSMKLEALNELYQMNTDQMVYIGSSDVGATGLINDPNVTAASAAAGASTSTLWSTKTPDEILTDINTALSASWLATGYKMVPTRVLLPPTQFALIHSMKVSTAGNVSVAKFLEDNSISLKVNGKALEILPCKWLTGAGAGATDRAVVYTKDLQRVRFPMVPMRRETAYYHGIRFAAPYLWAFGQVEWVYPETARYVDGI